MIATAVQAADFHAYPAVAPVETSRIVSGAKSVVARDFANLPADSLKFESVIYTYNADWDEERLSCNFSIRTNSHQISVMIAPQTNRAATFAYRRDVWSPTNRAKHAIAKGGAGHFPELALVQTEALARDARKFILGKRHDLTASDIGLHEVYYEFSETARFLEPGYEILRVCFLSKEPIRTERPVGDDVDRIEIYERLTVEPEFIDRRGVRRAARLSSNEQPHVVFKDDSEVAKEFKRALNRLN